MNAIVSIIDGFAVTTSLAIADGAGNQHKNVLELIKNNIGDFQEFGPLAFETRPFKTPGGTQNRQVALLNEQQSTLLMTYLRNSDVVKAFKKRLVKAFYELAQSKAIPADLSRMDILQMAIESEKEKLLLKSEVEALKPKADFYDKVVEAPDAISVGDAAKVLGTGRRRLFTKLRTMGWVTRKNQPYQTKIEQGLLDVKLGNWEHPDHGLQQSVTTLITGKGMVKLRENLEALH